MKVEVTQFNADGTVNVKENDKEFMVNGNIVEVDINGAHIDDYWNTDSDDCLVEVDEDDEQEEQDELDDEEFELNDETRAELESMLTTKDEEEYEEDLFSIDELLE